MTDSQISSRYIIGIDLSIHSPAVSIFDTRLGVLYCGFAPQQQTHLTFVGSNLDVASGDIDMLLECVLCGKQTWKSHPTHYTSGIAKYAAVVNSICQYILRRCIPPSHSLVVIEGYSFHSVGGSRCYELGGILRYKLFSLNIPFIDVAPSSNKKHFTGHGTATKMDMYRTYRTYFKLPHIVPLLHTRGKTLTEEYKVSSPEHDIVDSIALIHYGCVQYNILFMPRLHTVPHPTANATTVSSLGTT